MENGTGKKQPPESVLTSEKAEDDSLSQNRGYYA
jgi:hypothetical protein